MRKLNCAFIILNIFGTTFAANKDDCEYFYTINKSKFERLSLDDICFNPEKLLAVNEKMCNDNNTTFVAVINMIDENERNNYLDFDFVIKENFETHCERYFSFKDAVYSFQWGVENEELVILVPGVTMNKSDYCLKLTRVKNVSHYVIEPQICGVSTNVVNVYTRSISVFFMMLSVGIYLFSYLPRNDSVHNKCCSRYMICKTITFTLRSIDVLYLHLGIIPPELLCVLIFFFSYFYVLATYVWLLTINYNIWKLLSTYGTWNTGFPKLNKFVWLFTSGLVIISFTVDGLFSIGRSNQSQTKTNLLSCYLITYDWSAIIFVHGPAIILILINVILAIMTGRHIYLENARNAREFNRTDIKDQIRNKANFLFFFRLFIFTGASSILDKLFTIFIITGIFNNTTLYCAEPILSLQGVLLFVITILRKEVIKSIRLSFQRKKTLIRGSEVTEMTETN